MAFRYLSREEAIVPPSRFENQNDAGPIVHAAFAYELELRRLKLVREWIAVFAGLIGLAYLFATLLNQIL